MPPTTPSSRKRWRGSVSSPKRRESMLTHGRAPMVKMSRTMPPTPVAAPWKGSTARRVVVALDLHGHGPAVADVDDAGVLAGALQDARPAGGEAAEDGPRVLVAAVLAPHERVDGELDVRGLAVLDALDVLVLVLGEAELDGRGEVGRAVHVLGAHAVTSAPRRASIMEPKKPAPVGPAGELGLDRVLRVRHHAEHVAGLVADAGDVVEGAVGVGALGPLAGGVDVAHDDLVVGLQLLEASPGRPCSCPRCA